MKVEQLKISNGSMNIPTIFSSPDDFSGKRRLVILLHGGPGGSKDGPSDLFIQMTEKFIEANIATLRFDFMGEGESQGDYINMTISSQVSEFRKIIEFARSLKMDSLGLVGESYGATIALSGYDKSFKALALLWPAIWLLDTTFNNYLSDESKQSLKTLGYIQEGNQKIGQGFIDELVSVNDVSGHLSSVGAPTILIQGDSDSEVPHWQSQKAFELLRGQKELIVVPGGDHCLRRPREQSLVVQKTLDWFVKYL